MNDYQWMIIGQDDTLCATYLLKIECKIGTLRIPRLVLSDFTIGHHSTIVKKKKCRNLICLPCFLFSSPPSTRAAHPFGFDITFRVLATTLCLSLFNLFPSLHTHVPSIFKIETSSVLRFPEVLTLPSLRPACVSLFARAYLSLE